MRLKPPYSTRFDHGQRRQAIVESLIADVLQGRLHAGQHLGTQELAVRHGVSHTPIREALIVMAGVGIIDLLPNRGAVVRNVTVRDVREVCQVRRVLECEAIRRACGAIDRTELESLRAELKRLMRGARQSRVSFIAQARALDDRLHDLIAASCGNRFLARELTRLKIVFRAFRDMAWAYEELRSDSRRLAGEAKEHLAIVDALMAENAKGAAKAMAEHIRSGFKYWSRALPTTAIGHSSGVQTAAISTRHNGSSNRPQENGKR